MNYQELQQGIEKDLPIPSYKELWEAIEKSSLDLKPSTTTPTPYEL
jgi:hypothetical protein